jgi:glycosyltransferase involved in cell wall biosynthesis
LHRLGLLHRLVQSYPKLYTRRWGIPDTKVASILSVGIAARLVNRLPHSLQQRLMPSLHDAFSRRLARYVPADSDVLIGLSSFCLEAIQQAGSMGVATIVDHGSLHQRTESRLLTEELQRLGLPDASPGTSQWIIDKEDREFQAADRVMVLSAAAKRSLVEEGISANKIFVNACGVDLSCFKPHPRSDDVFRVVFCGAITPRKGIHDLMRAFSELRMPKAELWVVGGSTDHAYRHALERFAGPGVRFLGTFPQAGLASIYSQGSVFVLPSIADGFGMVVTQALACGLPAIVSANVGAADVVREGENGFVIPIRDVDALKERLERLYRDPALRYYMSQTAARDADKRLSWNAYGERLASFLQTVVPSTRQPGITGSN